MEGIVHIINPEMDKTMESVWVLSKYVVGHGSRSDGNVLGRELIRGK